MRYFKESAISCRFTLFLISGLLLSCNRSTWRQDFIAVKEEGWAWGGSSSRSGEVREEISLPLDLMWTVETKSAPGPALSAVGSYLFVPGLAGEITVVSLETGEAVHTFPEAKKSEVTCLAYGDRLWIVRRQMRPSLYCLSLTSRELLWDLEMEGATGEPLKVGDRIYIGNGAGELLTLGAYDGELIWRTGLDLPLVGSPAYSGGCVAGTMENGGIWCCEAERGTLLWRKEGLGTFLSGPVILDSLVVAGTREGICYGLALSDGSILWRKELDGGVYTRAAATKSRIYVGTSLGNVYGIRADNGEILWQYRAESGIGCPPLLSGKWLFAGTLDRKLVALNRRTGERVWQQDLRGRCRTTPVIWKGMLLAASEDRYVYGFGRNKDIP
jgi:outer membrane protein assembly factor BamB